MNRAGKIIAAQAALFLASLPLGGVKPLEAGQPPPTSEEKKGHAAVFIRAAQPDANVSDSTGAYLDADDTTTLSADQLQHAWEMALAIADDDPPPCKHSDTTTVAEKNAPPIIVIDLGHRYETEGGLVDSGTVNRNAGLVEADIIDAVGARLVQVLRDRGHEVVLTRNPHEPMPHTRGDYRGSLSVRGLLPAYLSEETGRPVILLSLHVDNGRPGGSVYVQNDSDGQAAPESLDLAESVARAYRIGGEGAHVNPGGDMYKGRGRFDNRMLRSFTAARNVCPAVEGAAALLEMGDIRFGPDIAAFRRLMRDPGPVASTIAQGLEDFIRDRYQPRASDRATPLLVMANPGLKLIQ